MKKPRKPKPKHRQGASRPHVGRAVARVSSRIPEKWDGWDRVLERTAKARAQHRGATALALSYSRDERSSLALLLLPFFIMALAMGITQTMKGLHQPEPYANQPDSIAAPRAPTAAEKLDMAIKATPRTDVAAAAIPHALAPVSTSPVPISATAVGSERKAADVVVPVTSASLEAPPAPLASVAGATSIEPSPVAEAAAATAAEARSPAPATAPVPAGSQLSRLATPDAVAAVPGVRIAALAPHFAYPEIASREAPVEGLGRPSVCEAPASGFRQSRPAIPLAATQGADPATFGQRLAAAAEGQTSDLVVYTDRYRRIAYPMGDVSAQFGVCTDVVIRAYRTVGLDLQMLVQQTRAGSGDASIDHRRVETLRRFFSAHGVSLRPSEYAEDYKPGDIVSYYRPQNRHSKTHIAIVSDKVGASGHPMIIHNRGWGPQIEDGLFVDQITGHYRFAGLGGGSTRIATAAMPQVAAIPAPPSPAAGGQKAPGLGVGRSSRPIANMCKTGGTGGDLRMCPQRPAVASAQRGSVSAESAAR